MTQTKSVILLLSGILCAILLIVAIGQAAESEPVANTVPILATPEHAEWINPSPLPEQDESQDQEGADRSINDLLSIGNDSCNGAGTFNLLYDGERVPIEGSETNVSNFTSDPADPTMRCIGPDASRLTGYRSAWFRVVAPADGILTVRSVTDQDHKRNYDTVIQVYADLSDPTDSTSLACENLSYLGCNDDHYALLSSVNVPVVDGQTYYIEVVDRNIASSGNVILNLELELTPAEGWLTAGNSMPKRLSRHSVVIDNGAAGSLSDDFAYIIAGQTTLGSAAVRTGETWRYNPRSDSWQALAEMPAARTVDGVGYSNTDAVLLGDDIHLVSGFVGVEDDYDGTHWTYNIPSNVWSTVTNPRLDWSTAMTTTASGVGEPVGYSELTPYQFNTQSGFYLVGGLTGQFLASESAKVEPSTIFQRFTVEGNTRTWQPLPNMSRPRYAHTAVSIGNSVCVVGGLTVEDGQNKIITDGECFSRTTQAWSPNVAALNVPRYMAGSAVSADGTWYVFGGIDASGNYVSEIEVHDFTGPSWRILSNNFDIDDPAMAWLRGGFINNRLYLFGGEQSGERPVGVVQSKLFPNSSPVAGGSGIYLPIVGSPETVSESFLTAVPIGIGQSLHANFDGLGDVYDVYTFSLGGPTSVMIDLFVPHGADYDLILYDENKNVITVGQALGENDEWIHADLGAGQYYIFVARTTPPPSLPPVDANYGLFLGLNQ